MFLSILLCPLHYFTYPSSLHSWYQSKSKWKPCEQLQVDEFLPTIAIPVIYFVVLFVVCCCVVVPHTQREVIIPYIAALFLFSCCTIFRCYQLWIAFYISFVFLHTFFCITVSLLVLPQSWKKKSNSVKSRRRAGGKRMCTPSSAQHPYLSVALFFLVHVS